LRLRPLRHRRLWQLLVCYLALGKTGSLEQRLEDGMSSENLPYRNWAQPLRTSICPRVWQLNDLPRRIGGLWSMKQGAL
jgi:hypothetical protein